MGVGDVNVERSMKWSQEMLMALSTYAFIKHLIGSSVPRKKLPNVYKNCPKMTLQEKL